MDSDYMKHVVHFNILQQLQMKLVHFMQFYILITECFCKLLRENKQLLMFKI